MKQRKNILFLTAWSFRDALVQTYTLPYVRIIQKRISSASRIYFVTIEQPTQKINSEEKKRIRSQFKSEGIEWISFQSHGSFFLNVLSWGLIIARLFFLILFNKIDFIHAWCTPAGSLGYLLSVMTGKKLIIDSYEPHAEAMVENKTWRKSGLKFNLLFYFERKLSAHAFKVIAATEAMKEYALKKYSVPFNNNFYVKPACIDVDYVVQHKKKLNLLTQYDFSNKIVCVYAGKFGGIYLAEEIFQFLKVAEDYWGDRFRVFLLTNYPKEVLIQWAKQSGFSWDKVILNFVPHEEVADYIGLADFAITPVKPVPTKRYCTPIKDAEYWAMGLPIVITKNISDDSDIIEKNNIGYVLKELNEEEYKRAVKKIAELIEPSNVNSLTEKIIEVARTYRDFSIAEEVYSKIYS